VLKLAGSMGIKVKETTPQHIEELRERFNSKYASSPPAGKIIQNTRRIQCATVVSWRV